MGDVTKGGAGGSMAVGARRGQAWAVGTVAALAVLSVVSAVAPAPAQAQDGADGSLGSYGIVAFDPASEQLGLLVASTDAAAASDRAALEAGTGAALLLGGGSAEVGRAVLDALRGGATARAAREGAPALDGPTAVLAPGCDGHAASPAGAVPWSGTRQGTVGDVCYVAVGSVLSDAGVLDRLVQGFEGGSGPLLDRFMAALREAEQTPEEATRNRSAALWIAAPDAEGGALGRADLRLHVEAVQRPVSALEVVIQAARSEHLARRAERAVSGGEHERALELADDAAELDPTTARAWLARGRALLYLEREDEAETAFQRMLEVNPYLLHVLGDPGSPDRSPEVREGYIPYRPRLLQRLDVYRREYYSGVDFPGEAALTGSSGGGG